MGSGGAVATIVSVGAGTTAGAAPKDKAETFICDGEETTFIVGGRIGLPRRRPLPGPQPRRGGDVRSHWPSAGGAVPGRAVDERAHGRAAVHGDVHRDEPRGRGDVHDQLQRHPHQVDLSQQENGEAPASAGASSRHPQQWEVGPTKAVTRSPGKSSTTTGRRSPRAARRRRPRRTEGRSRRSSKSRGMTRTAGILERRLCRETERAP